MFYPPLFFFLFLRHPEEQMYPRQSSLAFFCDKLSVEVREGGWVGGWAQGLRHKAPSVAREAKGASDVCEVGKFGNFTKAS